MALRGNAAFLWTVDGANYVHRLGSPLRNITPALFRRSFSHPTADGTSINTVSIGDGVWEYQATLRYDALPDSLLRMLRDGVDQTTLTYARDLTGGDEYDVMLIPGSGPTGMPTAQPDADMWWRGHYQVTVLLRATSAGPIAAHVYGTVDGNRVVFRHRGGEPMDDWSFSRAAVAGADTYRQRDGTLGEVTVDDVARTHWLDLDGDGVFEEPSLLLELGRANVASNPNTLSSWSTGGTPNVTGGQSDPAGGTDGWLLEDDDGTATENLSTGLSFTGDGTKAASIRLKAGTAAETEVSVFDNTAGTHRHRIIVTWTDGVPSLSTSIGSGTLYPIETLADGWYEIGFSADGVLAGNTNRLFLYPAGLTASATGTVYAYIGQAEDGEFPTSALNTTTARNVEVASHVMPAAIVDPSTPWTGYFRWVAGMDGNGGESFPLIWTLGTGSLATAKTLKAYWLSASAIRFRHNNATGLDTADISGLPITRGDTCEAVVKWLGTGVATLYLWVNGTYINSATLSGITPASAWGTDASGDVRVYYNSLDGGNNAGAMSLRDSVLVEGVVSGTAAQIRSAFTRYVDA